MLCSIKCRMRRIFSKKSSQQVRGSIAKTRAVDAAVEVRGKQLSRSFRMISSRQVSVWKAFLTVVFLVGFVVALIWVVRVDVF